MKWKDVTSSALDAVGYDVETLEFAVRFKHGGEYTYPGVPEDVACAVLAAPSVGSAFIAQIKNGGYA